MQDDGWQLLLGVYSLIETATLNGVYRQEWRAEVLFRTGNLHQTIAGPGVPAMAAIDAKAPQP